MKNFLVAFKKHFLGYLRYIAPMIPVSLALWITSASMLTAPYKSTNQFIWFVSYTFIAFNAKTWVSITDHLITKALQDDKA